MNVLYLRGLKSIKKVSQISIKNYLIIIYSMIHTNRQMQFRVKNIYIFKKSNSYIKKTQGGFKLLISDLDTLTTQLYKHID